MEQPAIQTNAAKKPENWQDVCESGACFHAYMYNATSLFKIQLASQFTTQNHYTADF